MHKPSSTDKHINKLIEFRQALYDNGFTCLKDAQFELLDALLLSGPIRSFPELSLNPVFRRQWPSAYAAVEDGGQDSNWLRRYLCSQVPGVEVFALDTTAWPRPSAPTLPDRQYVHSPTSAIGGSSTVVGHCYSMLSWIAQSRSSWALPVDIERISSSRNAVEVGVAQVEQLCQLRGGFDLIVGDGSYGNHRFLRPLRDQPCGLLVRLRRDRVLYGNPPPYNGRGRPNVHGKRFAFKEPDTWTEPQQHLEFQDPQWGKVEIQYWSELHARQASDTPFDVLRVKVHLEKECPPQALWLAWQGPAWPVYALWRCYQLRWPIESSIRWRKQQLHWTMPQFRSPEASDRWTILVSLAQWMMYLARPVAQDKPLPWQKAQSDLTPGRVQQGLGGIFTQIGTPAGPPKTRGKSPGWPKGRPRDKPVRYPVVRKGPKKPKPRRKAA